MTTAPTVSEDTEVAEEVAVKPRSTRKHKRKADPQTKRDTEEVDVFDPVVVAHRRACYCLVAGMALDGKTETVAVKALTRRGLPEEEAAAVVGRVYAEWRLRWA